MLKYADAIQRVFCRREAFALAQPSSVLLLGFGSSFLYQDGILCYLYRATIRILDVHGASATEKVIDLNRLGQAIWKFDTNVPRIELVHYQDDILTLTVYTNLTEQAQLVILNTENDIPDHARVRLVTNCPGCKFWVRNDSRYLYLGTRDGLGRDGHREWLLHGWDLTNHHQFEGLQLSELFGTDLGQTVSFQVHDGFFYAISNQSSAEVEEIDWTSYYHCYRFPLQDPSPEAAEPKQLWRRQHREGVINDSWTELSLQKDECTGNLLITECRREWKDGGSTQRRTYYRQPLIFPYTPGQVPDHLMLIHPGPPDAPHLPPAPGLSRLALPVGDPLVGLLDAKNKPLYEAAHQRIDRDCHHEYPNDEAMSQSKSFILAKTKHRAYISSCSAFLDLVIDDNADPQRQWTHQIRLRIGSRIQSSPLGPEGLLRRPLMDDADGNPIEDSENRFTSRGINIWPTASASVELLDLLNPFPGPKAHLYSKWAINGGVRAISDERSIVYMAKESSEVESAIVLVNFDSWIRFGGLTPMKTNNSSLETEDSTRKVVINERSEATGKGKNRATAIVEESDLEKDEEGDQSRPWFREEKAMHLNIGKGFQFI